MKKIAVATLVAGITLMASPLSDSAKKAGLLPIPNEQTALLKLIDNPKNPITKEKVELGKMLYFDPRLSKSGFISCNSCHNLAMGGTDNVEAAIGHKWRENPHHLNSPTVYNAVFNSVQFWDGRDPSLEKQAQGPIQAAPEMAASKAHVVATVTSMPGYVEAFKKAYGSDVKIDFEKVTDTIGLFERTLVTPSRFDDFMQGDDKALSLAEKEGLKTFIEKGCASCHNGVGLGGSMQPFGVVAPYKYANVGDFKGDANGMVRVPTLRNIAQTAPYFHNGMVKTLKEAIVEMGRIQLGVSINDKESNAIEHFLGALTGRKPAVGTVILPDATNETPRSDIE